MTKSTNDLFFQDFNILSLNCFQLFLGISLFQFTHSNSSAHPYLLQHSACLCDHLKAQDYAVAAFQAAAITWITMSSQQLAGLHVTKIIKHSNTLQQGVHTKWNFPTPGITNGTLGSIALLPPTQQAGLGITAQHALSTPWVSILAGQEKTLQRLKTRHSPYLNH